MLTIYDLKNQSTLSSFNITELEAQVISLYMNKLQLKNDLLLDNILYILSAYETAITIPPLMLTIVQ